MVGVTTLLVIVTPDPPAMASGYTSLCDLGPVALSYRPQIEEVKKRIGVTHGFFDAWIFGFLENKNFNINETVAKLERRFVMEKEEMGSYKLTDHLRKNLRDGVIQEIGEDKHGRVVFYIYSKRDFPTPEYREEKKMIFNMFMSYGTRLRESTKRSQIVMIFNQQDSSFFKNLDLGFQGDIALHISKFFPGMVEKMYMCKMSSTLSFMAKPVLSRLPAVVSERLEILSDSDIKKGALLEHIDKSVLPFELGGTNNCDCQSNWNAFADNVENYFFKMVAALNERNMTIKEFELDELGYDTNGMPKRLEPSASFHPPLTRSGEASVCASGIQSAYPLLSCRSNYDVESTELGAAGGTGNPSLSANATQWKSLFSVFPPSLSIFFVEELVRWKQHTEEEEEANRYKILFDHAQSFAKVHERNRNVAMHTAKTFSGNHVMAFVKFWVSVVSVLISLYFVLGMIFWALFASSVIITMYFSFFIRPTFFFPVCWCIIMVFVQGCGLCARSLEIIYALWRGKVMPPFERLGGSFGAVAEIILLILVALAQIIVFFYYYLIVGVTTALAYTFSAGWLGATCLILLNHGLFFVGLFHRQTRANNNTKLLKLSVFLTAYQGHLMDSKIIRSSSVLLCLFFLAISLLLGVGFLISRLVHLFLVSAMTTVVASYAINFFCDGFESSLSGMLMTISIWIYCFTWLYTIFICGFNNASDYWIISVVISSVISGALTLSSFVALKQKKNNKLLRGLYLFVLAYFISCWISSFFLLNWKSGIICFGLMVHNGLNFVFGPSQFSGSRSSLVVSMVFLLLLVTCVSMGWHGTVIPANGKDYSWSTSLEKSASTTHSLARDSVWSPSLLLYHQYPVCEITIGTDDPSGQFGIADVSKLLEVAAGVELGSISIEANLKEGFPGKDIQYDGIVYENQKWEWTVQQFSSSAGETTFLISQEFSPSSAILSAVLWVEAIAARPFKVFLPEGWMEVLISVTSSISHLFPFPVWEKTKILEDILREKVENGENILVLSAGTGAGSAAYAVCSIPDENISASGGKLQSILFNTPGLRYSPSFKEKNWLLYHHRVLNIITEESKLEFVGGLDTSVTQMIWCGSNISNCASQKAITNALVNACELGKPVIH